MSTSFHIDYDSVVIYPPTQLAEGLQFAKEKGMHNIRIQGNPNGVFDLDLNAFSVFPEVERLMISNNFKIGEVIHSDAFYQTKIHSLSLAENINFPIELHRFSQLKHLEMTETSKLKISKLPDDLQRAKIWKLSHDDLSVFQHAKKLKSLELISPKITSLSGLEHCQELEELFLFSASKLTDIRSVNSLKNLKRLEFERCKLMTQSVLDGIKLDGLKRLDVRFTVEDLSFLKNFPNLEEFYFTEVKDGNLNPILESKIHTCGFPSKKHYSHKWNELSSLLKNNA